MRLSVILSTAFLAFGGIAAAQDLSFVGDLVEGATSILSEVGAEATEIVENVEGATSVIGDVIESATGAVNVDAITSAVGSFVNSVGAEATAIASRASEAVDALETAIPTQTNAATPASVPVMAGVVGAFMAVLGLL